MKTRNIILGICLLGMLGFISCESGKVKNTNTTKAFGSLAEFYQDSVYLSFEGNLHEPEVIWGHQDIYVPAYERMRRHLHFEGDTLNWDFKSAEEIKVSENIYEYVIWFWSYDNNLLRTGNYTLFIDEDGYYMLKSKKTNTSKATIIEGNIPLTWNAHKSNMANCIRAFPLLETLRLPCVIKETKTNLRGDGFGGRTIYGSGENSEGGLWGYYVCDPCDYEDRFNCDLNKCVGYRTDDAGARFYEKACNKLGSPLMTLTNKWNFKQ